MSEEDIVKNGMAAKILATLLAVGIAMPTARTSSTGFRAATTRPGYLWP